MLPLRFAWVWLSLGWLLTVGIVVGSLLPGPAVSAFMLNDKLLHAGAYAVLMLWFAGMFPAHRHWLIALLLIGLGFCLDLMQSGISTRSFDLLDVAANTGGILVALTLGRFLLGGWCRRVERWLFPESRDQSH
jgi:hypothetical protein